MRPNQLSSMLLFIASSCFVIMMVMVRMCHGQVLGVEQMIGDTNISMNVISEGRVSSLYYNGNALNAMGSDAWVAGVRNTTDSLYDIQCNVMERIAIKSYNVIGDIMVSMIHQCDSSPFYIHHVYQRSLSTSMMKAVVTLHNTGTSILPVVQYRHYVNIDANNDTNNFMYNVFPDHDNVTKVILSCVTNQSYSPDLDVDDISHCLKNPITGAHDYKVQYEFRFGPITAGANVSFTIYYGGGTDLDMIFDELAKNHAEMANIFTPSETPYGPNLYYVGYSGLDGNATRFVRCSSESSSGNNTGGNNNTGDGGGGGAICFSGFNTVQEKYRGIIPLTELKIGDYVKTGHNDENDDDDYTQVYGFGHYDPIRIERFLQFHLVDDNDTNNQSHHNDGFSNTVMIMEISKKHLLFLDGPALFATRAEQVRVGDWLHGKKRVIQVNHVIRQGVYAPLTMSGTISVSGCKASNYVDISDDHSHRNNEYYYHRHHVIGHAAFAPKRFFCHYFMNTCRNEIYIDGYGSYTRFMIWCASLLFHKNLDGVITSCFYAVVMGANILLNNVSILFAVKTTITTITITPANWFIIIIMIGFLFVSTIIGMMMINRIRKQSVSNVI